MNVLTGVIGMGCMGKTIALKLTQKEEKIIAELNKLGLSNSDLLRNALREYLAYIHESSNEDNELKNIFVKQENKQIRIFETFKELKQEMQQLREEMKKTQKQFENDMTSLQRRLYLLSVSHPTAAQDSTSGDAAIVHDIHQEVDEFLKKQ